MSVRTKLLLVAVLGLLGFAAWRSSEAPSPAVLETPPTPGALDGAAGVPHATEPPTPPEPAVGNLRVERRVVHAHTLEPLSGVRLVLRGRRGPGDEFPLTEAISGSAGEFVIEDPGVTGIEDLVLVAQKAGFVPTAWIIEAGSTAWPLGPMEMAPGHVVGGRVVGPDDEPVSGGEVLIFDPESSDDDDVQRLAIGPKGQFEARVLRAYTAAQVEVPGFAPVITDRRPTMVLWGTYRVKKGAEARFHVTDMSGQPVPEASVLVVPGVTHTGFFFETESLYRVHSRRRARTDASGDCSIPDLPPGGFQVFVSHPEHPPRHVEREGGESDPISVVLGSGRWLTVALPPGAPGRVFIRVPGEGRVALIGQGDHHRSDALDPRSGRRGLLRVPGYLPVMVEWPAGVGVHELRNLRWDRGLDLAVEVRDRAGNPLAGAMVEVASGAVEDVDPSCPSVALTDVNGRGRVSGLTAGPHELIVAASGFATVRRVVHVEEVLEPVQVTVSRAVLLTARVLDPSGGPLADPELYVLGQRDLERVGGADGTVRLDTIPPDEALEGRIHAEGYLLHKWSLPPLAAGAVHDLGDVQLALGGTFRGVVLDTQGTPYVGATVELGWRYEAVTDLHGSFVITGVETGNYEIRAEHLEALELPSSGEVFMAPDDDQSVTLEMPRGAVYALEVFGPGGDPVKGAYAELSSDEVDWYPEEQRTDERGKVFWRGVPRATELTLRVGKGTILETVTAKSPTLLPTSIRFPRSGSLEVTVRRSDGAPLGGFCLVDLSYEDLWFARSAGTFPDRVRIDDLVGGTYDLVGRAAGCSASRSRSVVVVPGRVTQVELEVDPLPPARRIPVVVRDGEGRPVPAARVGAAWVTLTDEAGRAEVEFRDEDNDHLSVEKVGYVPATLSGALSAATEPIEITLSEAGTIWIDVRRADGGSTGEGEIVIESAATREVQWLDWDSTDGWVAEAPPGLYVGLLEVKGEVLDERSFEVRPGQRTEVLLDMPLPFVVTGTVSHAGQPVAGGHVWLLEGGFEDPHVPVDHRGRFEMELFDPGTYVFRYSPVSGQHRFVEQVFRIDGPGSIALEGSSVRAHGFVVDASDRPLLGIRLEILVPGGVERVVTTDGGFSLQLIPGTYRWRILDSQGGVSTQGVAHWTGDTPVKIRVGASRQVRFEGPGKTAPWRLEVRDREFHRVFAERESWDGEMTVELPLGIHRIQASNPVWQVAWAVIEVSPDTEIVNLPFEVGGVAVIQASLEARPDALGGSVRLRGQGARENVQAVNAIGPDGEATFAVPVGTYQVKLGDLERTLEVRAGQVTTVQLP